jgi:F-type H+-transporting ATPase subunit alpha
MPEQGKKKRPEAFLYSNVAPDAQRKERFENFIKNKYGQDYELVWIEDESITSGFKLIVGNEVYDWTKKGRMEQMIEMLHKKIEESDDNLYGSDLITLFQTSLDSWKVEALPEEEGTVIMVGDGIVFAEGLESVVYGEIVVFESGIRGMVQDLRPDSVGIILFGDEESIMEGSRVRRTKKTAGVPVGEGFLGRVINALGDPIDNQGSVIPSDYYPIEAALLR